MATFPFDRGEFVVLRPGSRFGAFAIPSKRILCACVIFESVRCVTGADTVAAKVERVRDGFRYNYLFVYLKIGEEIRDQVICRLVRTLLSVSISNG